MQTRRGADKEVVLYTLGARRGAQQGAALFHCSSNSSGSSSIPCPLPNLRFFVFWFVFLEEEEEERGPCTENFCMVRNRPGLIPKRRFKIGQRNHSENNTTPQPLTTDVTLHPLRPAFSFIRSHMTLGMNGDTPHVADTSPYIAIKDSLFDTGIFLKNNLPAATTACFRWTLTMANKLNFLPQLFNLTYVLSTSAASGTFYLVGQVLRGLGLLVWAICEPFHLIIRIVEYNAHAFIDIWLQLLFNTKLENLLRVDYGMSQLRVVAQWIRFINVMCITGMVLGISTYYTMIRVIYWLTKLENKSTNMKEKENVLKQELKETTDLKKRLDLVTEFETLRQHTRQAAKTTEPPSLLEEFIQREQEALHSDSQQTVKIQESTPPFSSNRSTPSIITNEHSLDQIRFERILRDDQDEDIYNYETLNSLASGSSTTVSSPLQRKEDSPVTQAFRSRLSSLNSAHSDDSTPYGTIGSSVFSSTRTSGSGLPPMTPITTIEEDVEDEVDDRYK